MTRPSSLMVAAFAAAAIFTGSAVAQFKVPKITIPNIKKEAPKTPTTTDQDSSDDRGSSTSNTASAARNEESRGRPISGAKITFSNNPDGSNPKTTFTSSEYIYGRLDLGGRTV